MGLVKYPCLFNQNWSRILPILILEQIGILFEMQQIVTMLNYVYDNNLNLRYFIAFVSLAIFMVYLSTCFNS